MHAEAETEARAMTVDEFLDIAKERHGVTDWKLSALLEVVPSAIKNYRAGRSLPDDAVAGRLARLANYDPGFVIACVHAQRAGNPDARNAWVHVISQLNPRGNPFVWAAAAVILSALFGFDGGPDAGAALLSSVAISAENGLYIMSTLGLALGVWQWLSGRAKPHRFGVPDVASDTELSPA